MPSTAPAKSSDALNHAFEALTTYEAGSSRAALLPIDEAVIASLEDRTARQELEQRLLAALKHGGSAPALEYVCSKLGLIGSGAAVPALAERLHAPATATAARTALDAIPGGKTTKALRDCLPKVDGLQRIGVINSLGTRRDAQSVRALAAIMEHADAGIAKAAAAALGDIATSEAATHLREFLPKAPEAVTPKVADAILACAERKLSAGQRKEAQALYQLLATSRQPKHVQQAAARGLEVTLRWQ